MFNQLKKNVFKLLEVFTRTQEKMADEFLMENEKS